MKLRRLTLCFTCFFVLTASAQTPEVLRKLNRTYAYVGPFVDGLAVVCRGVPDEYGSVTDGRYGFVDTTGGVRVPLKYDGAWDFSGPAAAVSKWVRGAEKFGIVARDGRELTPCEWNFRPGPMTRGVTVVTRGEVPEVSFWLIDSLGKLTQLDCSYCDDSSEGLYVAGYGEWVEKDIVGLLKPVYRFAGKKGFIDDSGKLVIPAVYDDAGSFHEGLAAVGQQGKYHIKWGYIDRNGQTVVPFDYFEAGNFVNGLAVVGKVQPGGRIAYGYITPDGSVAIACKFGMATPFRYDYAWVGDMQDGQMVYWMIDRQGNDVLETKVYDLNESHTDGYATCAIRVDGVLRYGVLDKNGAVAIPFIYDFISLYSMRDTASGKPCYRIVAERNGQDAGFYFNP